MKTKIPTYISHQRAFSLIELIIAVGVFSVAATFAVGSLVSLTEAQRKASALQSAMDNIRFGLEAMSKEMRTGVHYTNPITGKPFPASEFKFVNARGATVQYRLKNNVIEKASSDVLPAGCSYTAGTPGNFNNDNDCYQPYTDSALRVDLLDFFITNEESGINRQPFVTIVVKATANKNISKERADIHLQTSVAPRKFFR